MYPAGFHNLYIASTCTFSLDYLKAMRLPHIH